MNEFYGARLERGVIRSAGQEGYIVASLDREGIESTPIPASDCTTYEEGERVYFFLFADGTGFIFRNM